MNPILDGSMLDNYGGTISSTGGTSDFWSGFVNTGADFNPVLNGSMTSNYGGNTGIAEAVKSANGGDITGGIFSYISGAASDFWNGGGDAKAAATNRGLIGSVLGGVGQGAMQMMTAKKTMKTQAEMMRERQRADAAEREKYSSLPEGFSKNVKTMKDFGV